MNPFDVLILAVVLLSVMYALYRGAVHSVLSQAALLISLLVALPLSAGPAEQLQGNTGFTSLLVTYTDAVARVGDYDLANTPVTGIGAKFDHPVCIPDHIQVMLDDDQGMPLGEEYIESLEQFLDIMEMESGRRLVENKENPVLSRTVIADREEIRQFDTLALSAGKGAGRLSELNIGESDIYERLQFRSDRTGFLFLLGGKESDRR